MKSMEHHAGQGKRASDVGNARIVVEGGEGRGAHVQTSNNNEITRYHTRYIHTRFPSSLNDSTAVYACSRCLLDFHVLVLSSEASV